MMQRVLLAAILVVLVLMLVGMGGAETWVYTSTAGSTGCGGGGVGECLLACGSYCSSFDNLYLVPGSTYYISASVTAAFDNAGCTWCNGSCGAGGAGSQIRADTACTPNANVCSNTGGGSASDHCEITSWGLWLDQRVTYNIPWSAGRCCPCSGSGTIVVTNDIIRYTASGNTDCIDETSFYILDGGSYHWIESTSSSSYSFDIYNGKSYRLTFDGAYYDFTCVASDVTFDYDACLYVYGYTCGIDTIKLYDDNSQLIETVNQASGYDTYEMQISSGQEYTISFYDLGIVLCYTHSFTSGGTDIRMDYDRCNWVYPPNPPAPPIPIYVWAGYDYNIVVFRDVRENFIENSQLAIYDKTDGKYLQRWADAADGYTLLGARFDTDHDTELMLRTFDGIFTLDTTYPANGSSEVGEENITTTNWTIPIKYNLNILPVDQYGMPLFDVFCGLSEYTPLNPAAFWGMDLSDRGYVPVTNCSGFAMCDIIAEKEGYADYKVEALNWTSKSALVKDYRHNIVMEEE